MKFRNMLIAGAAAVLVTLCGVGLLCYRVLKQGNADETWVNHTHRGIETLDGLLTDLVDAETGEGKHRMDRIRSLVSQMKQEDDNLLKQRLWRDAGTTRNARLLILGRDSFSFAFLIAAALLIHQQMGKRAGAEVELRESPPTVQRSE